MFSAGGGVGLVITVGKDVGVGVYVGLLVEESPDGPCARPIIRLPTCIQRGRRLAVCLAYRLPAGFAFGDKGRKIGPTARNGYGLLVSSPVSLGHHAAGPARQTGAKFDQPNAGSGNSPATRPPRRGFRRDTALAQFAGEPLAKAVKLNRSGIEPVAVQPFGLNRQMDMGDRKSVV